VHFTGVVPIGNTEPDAGVQVTVPVVAVALKATGPPFAFFELVTMFAGSFNTGPAGLLTVTLKVPGTPLPNAFSAVHVTVVSPIGKTEPDAGIQLIVAPPVAVGAGNMTAAPAEDVAVAVWFAGTEITGEPGFVTVTVNEPGVGGLTPSLAEHDTVVVPITKADPEGGVQVKVPVVDVAA
jgi:hypothetical protein